MAQLAVFPPGEAKEDWKILRALSEVARPHACRSTRSGQVRARAWPRSAPAAGPIDVIAAGGLGRRSARRGELEPARRSRSPITDFYQTDPISRASDGHGRMQSPCSSAATSGATGTHG